MATTQNPQPGDPGYLSTIPAHLVASINASDCAAEGILGFRALTESNPNRPGTALIRAWQIVTRTGVYEVDLDGLFQRASMLHAWPTNDDLVVTIAAGLLSEDGENTEYDRGIVEMTSDLLRLSTDDRAETEAMLRAHGPLSLVTKDDHPTDCGYCQAGESMAHTYQPVEHALDDCPWWNEPHHRRPFHMRGDCGGRMLDSNLGLVCETHLNAQAEVDRRIDTHLGLTPNPIHVCVPASGDSGVCAHCHAPLH